MVIFNIIYQLKHTPSKALVEQWVHPLMVGHHNYDVAIYHIMPDRCRYRSYCVVQKVGSRLHLQLYYVCLSADMLNMNWLVALYLSIIYSSLLTHHFMQVTFYAKQTIVL